MSSDLHHLAAAYALDALTPDERRAFEQHYPTCEICSREVDDFRATAGVLAQGAAVAPPPDLKGRVMAEIATTRQSSPTLPDTVVDLDRRRRRTRTLLLTTGAAAVVAAVVALVAVVGVVRSPAGPDVDDVLAAPDAVVTDLDGESGALTVAWLPDEDKVAVIGNDLGDPGPDRVYALWFLLDDGVAPAALFTPRQGAVGQVLAVDDLPARGWGVTIEPASGSPQPTGDIIFTGST